MIVKMSGPLWVRLLKWALKIRSPSLDLLYGLGAPTFREAWKGEYEYEPPEIPVRNLDSDPITPEEWQRIRNIRRLFWDDGEEER